MARTWIRQDIQIGSTQDTLAGFVDNTAPAATMESAAGTITDDLNNLRSMVSYFNDLQGGNWYDPLTTPATFPTEGAIRGLQSTADDLHELERKRVLVKSIDLTDITVPAGVAATGTLTSAGVFTDGDTVTIGSATYTMQSPFVDAADNIDASGTTAQTHENLRRAINNDGVAGTNYGTGTVEHPDVSAADTATTNVLTAKVSGTAGNAVVTTEVGANMSFGAATLTGGSGGDVSVLAGGELPPNTVVAIGAVTTLGTVAAALPGAVGAHSLNTVAGSTAISPKNLVEIVDGDSRDPIVVGNKRLWGLYQTASTISDGDTIAASESQVSLVVINDNGDDFEASSSGGSEVNFCFTERVALEDLTEEQFLRGAIVDVPGAATVTRQSGYDNQGTTPVDLTTNATLDLEGPGLSWGIRDDLEATLFEVVEGSAGGTSQVNVRSDVDEFDVDAAVNNFAAGATIGSGGARPITVGVTSGEIATTAGNLRIIAADEMYLDDVNQTGSTWAQTDGIKLSETTAEWDAFETAFGEVSLLNAIQQAYSGQIRTKVQATLTANVAASNDVNGPGTAHNNTDVDLAPFDNVTFNTDVDVFLNGELMRYTDDVVAGGTPADGDLQFLFNLKGTGTKPDQITVIVNGQ